MKEKKSKKAAGMNPAAALPDDAECHDAKCPFHGEIATRGRVFKGRITRLHHKRAVIEFERFIFVKKYERYARRKTRLHVHVPDCFAARVHIGDYVKARECRPISKMIHHVLTEIEPEGNTGKTAAGEEK